MGRLGTGRTFSVFGARAAAQRIRLQPVGTTSRPRNRQTQGNCPPTDGLDWFPVTSLAITDDGKRLVFLNAKQQSDVYVGQLSDGGSELKSPQRLTLDERNDWPGGWSPDGKAVLFYSNRNGSFDIFRQGVSERNPETIVSGM